MDEVTLELSTRRKARIIVGRGSLENAPKIIADLNPHLAVAIVDNRVPHHYIQEVIDGLENEGIPINTLRIDG
ncbi:MAG: 3-dehydroquinate synthase, partial [Crenarchaeota archaeon]|nr:3-dehydroquinate synthase [Thermoproteota archaeon]